MIYQAFQTKLPDFIRSEVSYRQSKCFPVAEGNALIQNRKLVYRREILKKFFESQLFLETRKKKDGFMVEQLVYSIAWRHRVLTDYPGRMTAGFLTGLKVVLNLSGAGISKFSLA